MFYYKNSNEDILHQKKSKRSKITSINKINRTHKWRRNIERQTCIKYIFVQIEVFQILKKC